MTDQGCLQVKVGLVLESAVVVQAEVQLKQGAMQCLHHSYAVKLFPVHRENAHNVYDFADAIDQYV